MFTSTNTALIKLYALVGPSVFRIGGNTVDQTVWAPNGKGGVSGQVAPADIARLAGFIKATGWKVIYGINMASSTPATVGAEALSASTALGSSLYGFEIGNEPDLYYENGIRPTTYTYSQFLSQWNALASGLRASVPNAVLTGPASSWNLAKYTLPFAKDTSATIRLLTQHYYRGNGQSSTSTMAMLLSYPDTALASQLAQLNSASVTNKIPDGFRLGEANSFYNSGRSGVSDGFGASLWVLDFLFQNAQYSQNKGVNFHTGGMNSPYSPLWDDGTSVKQIGGDFYGMAVFAKVANGTILNLSVSNTKNRAITAYAVAGGGANRIIVNNKDSVSSVVAVHLGSVQSVSHAWRLACAGGVSATSGFLLGGSAIGIDGSFTPSNNVDIGNGPATQFSFTLPAYSAVMIEFV